MSNFVEDIDKNKYLFILIIKEMIQMKNAIKEYIELTEKEKKTYGTPQHLFLIQIFL